MPDPGEVLPPGYNHHDDPESFEGYERYERPGPAPGTAARAPSHRGGSHHRASGQARAGARPGRSRREPASAHGKQAAPKRARRRRDDDYDELDDLHRGHPVLIGLAAVIVVIVIAGLLTFRWADKQINPSGPPGRKVTVVIPSDSSTAKIGDILAGAGVIHSATVWKYYAKVSGASDLLAGTYSLAENEKYSTVIHALQAGPKIITDKLVIPEGFTLQDIADRVAALPGFHLSAAKFMAASADGAVRSAYEPAGVDNLEGLVFPATYPVRQGETEVEILQTLVGQFDTEANSLGLTAAAAKLGMTPYQVVEVASIVEREAKLDTDRGNVASVLYNRLKAGMPLGADSTQTYYLRLTNPTLDPTAEQLDQPSPYNTRLNKGLPPTAIANAGVPSLQAAISPPTTTYLYFVETNSDGQLSFASTNAGFEQLEQQCQAAGLC